jgi:hypothetical protein
MTLLDAWAGVQFEGEELPEQTPAQREAVIVWNYLSSPDGGIDLGGLEIVAAHLGITDVGALLDNLLTIKTHKPPDKEGNGTRNPID